MVFVALIIWVTSVASAQDPAKALYVAEDSYLRWRLLPAEQEYLSIDGKHLKQYVEDLTAISRRYRDHGHPQFWGRITGTEADAENAQWLLDKFLKIGLSDVREQSLDLPPQWVPASWSVAASANGKTITHDGYFFAADTGGAIRGMHIDVFGGHTGCEIASLQKASYLGLKAGNPNVIVCEAVFATTVSSAPANLGSLVLGVNGSYTYTVANAATQFLGNGDAKVDSFDIHSADGTTKTVDFTFKGLRG